MQSLLRLHAGKNRIGKEGIPYIKNLTGLKYLGLESSGLTDEEVKEIVTLTNLESLNISHNDLSATAMQYVSKLPPFEILIHSQKPYSCKRDKAIQRDLSASYNI